MQAAVVGREERARLRAVRRVHGALDLVGHSAGAKARAGARRARRREPEGLAAREHELRPRSHPKAGSLHAHVPKHVGHARARKHRTQHVGARVRWAEKLQQTKEHAPVAGVVFPQRTVPRGGVRRTMARREEHDVVWARARVHESVERKGKLRIEVVHVPRRHGDYGRAAAQPMAARVKGLVAGSNDRRALFAHAQLTVVVGVAVAAASYRVIEDGGRGARRLLKAPEGARVQPRAAAGGAARADERVGGLAASHRRELGDVHE